MKLLLASKSATRRAMLTQAGVPFEVIASPADEDAEKVRLMAAGQTPREIAAGLALAKAAGVKADALVLGADQVLVCADGSILSKPRSPEDLAGQLVSLAGTTHQLHSAAVLMRGDEPFWEHSETVVLTMRSLSDAFIRDYIEREWDEVRWSVGGYRIEGLGAQLFERIEGSHFAILGLPLLPLLAELRRLGVLTQ